MFCKVCGCLLNGTTCPNCGAEGKREEPSGLIQGLGGLSEQERKEQEHIIRQRKKQEVWKVPDDG